MIRKQQIPLPIHQSSHGNLIHRIVDPVPIYAAFYQMRRQKLRHVVMDGIPGEAEFGRQLLPIGIPVP